MIQKTFTLSHRLNFNIEFKCNTKYFLSLNHLSQSLFFYILLWQFQVLLDLVGRNFFLFFRGEPSSLAKSFPDDPLLHSRTHFSSSSLPYINLLLKSFFSSFVCLTASTLKQKLWVSFIMCFCLRLMKNFLIDGQFFLGVGSSFFFFLHPIFLVSLTLSSRTTSYLT